MGKWCCCGCSLSWHREQCWWRHRSEPHPNVWLFCQTNREKPRDWKGPRKAKEPGNPGAVWGRDGPVTCPLARMLLQSWNTLSGVLLGIGSHCNPHNSCHLLISGHRDGVREIWLGFNWVLLYSYVYINLFHLVKISWHEDRERSST